MSIGKLKIARISFIGADMLLLVGLIFLIYYSLVVDLNLFQHILILPIIYFFHRLFCLSINDLTLLGNSPVIIIPEKTGWKIKFYQVINIEKTSKSYLILLKL